MSKIKEEIECFAFEAIWQIRDLNDKIDKNVSKDDIEYRLNQIEQLMYKLRKNTKGL